MHKKAQRDLSNQLSLSFQSNQSAIEQVSNQVTELQDKIVERDNKICNLDRTVTNLATSMQYMKLDMQKSERIRVELFNMVQKLKGPMRVYCRVKPMDPIS